MTLSAGRDALQPRRRQPPEVVAALVNGGLVLALPIPWVWFAWSSNTAVTPSRLYDAALTTLVIGGMMTALLPVALVVFWRTLVHAKRYLRHQGTGWQGVLEGGALGGGVALLILLQPILRQPLQAPPYVIVYAGGAFVIGLVLALELRMTGLLVLRLCRGRRAPQPATNGTTS
jgi:hypothetical protein